MGDIKVLTTERTVFPSDRRQFVSQRSYEGITRARMSIVKHAAVKVNTDPDPNGNENISASPMLPSINGVLEESSVTVEVIGEGNVAEDLSVPTNGKSEEAVDMLEENEEAEITSSSAVSRRSYEGFKRDRMTVVKRAEIKVNTDPDPNGNENISVPPVSPSINGVSEESSVAVGVVGEEDLAEDISEGSKAPTNGTSEGASNMLEKIVEDEIIPSTADDLSLSPMAFLHKGTDVVDGMITHFAESLTQKALDFCGKFTHRLEGAAKKITKKQLSVEGPPENNIHLFHRPSQQLIHMGLHIDEHDEGCRISRVIKDSIACRTKLKEDDVIMKINGFSLRCKSVGDVITHFSKIDITETFTLTIRRKIVTDNEEITFVDIDVQITIKISEGEIDFEVEVLVTAQKLKYQSSTKNKYIAQMPTSRSPVYMRVNGTDACMDTKTDKQSVFQMELYRGGSKGRRVCVLRNQSSYQVINGSNRKSMNELLATNAPSPNRKPVSSSDTKYFYWDSHPNKYDDVFESVNKRGYYIASTDSNKLVLRKFDSVRSVPPEARFRVIDVK